ncbi:hypothetical protein EG68_00979 [Paragonimus skrjabini miyazakii]|uniref:JmjC domain-containing protein n=1 Tax=Paragonimus skrjabini miyazakii TaxID=59628 RepID=A0A8S9Z404_9TREM|nr:hypothetical protein EG68_00979 [Paragonimus skrjabini miyazakii]
MPLSGSQEFIDSLLKYSFLSPDDCVEIMEGCEVNGHALICNGFTKPVLVPKQDGLRIRTPEANFCPQDLLTHMDPDLVVDVIDVRAQCEVQMVLREFVEHFNSCPRTKLLNMLSLEFSQSNLSTLVQPPHVVSELSLITNCWIPDAVDDDDSHDAPTSTPSVQKYCLLSMAGSYTDFHIDFGGSSVWYHVVWGEKTFYLIPPTQENLLSYWKWSWNPSQRTIFLPDVLHNSTPQTSAQCSRNTSPVYRLQVLPGQTILLPSGWILFGGNFLNELHIPMQLSVYRMEQKSGTPRKFQFPNFEKVHWFAADQIVGRLTNVLYDSQDPKPYELDAARCLSKVLPRWLEKRRSLSLEERCYYLPDRSTMELSCPQLIDKLHELISTFDPNGRNSRKTQMGLLLSDVDSSEESAKLSPFIFNLCRFRSDRFHWRVIVPFFKLNNAHSCKSTKYSKCQSKKNSLPKYTRHQTQTLVFPPCAVGGGLGWVPRRTSKPAPPETSTSSDLPNVPVTDDSDILEVIPELNESRLVGDHYFLKLSDSEEDECLANTSKRRHRSGASKRSHGRRSRDPDPTWSMSSPTHKKSGSRSLSMTPDRLLSPTTPRHQVSKICLTGGGLHPLLKESVGTPSSSKTHTSKRSNQKGFVPQDNPCGPSTTTASQKSLDKPRVNTTVRQRLAKRLGL